MAGAWLVARRSEDARTFPQVRAGGRRSGLALALAGLLAGAGAQAAERRTGVFRSILVGQGETAAQVACIACSVRVDGVVRGGAYVVLGRLDNRGSILGDSLVIGGTSESSGVSGGSAYLFGGLLRLHSSVEGDVVTAAGDLDLANPAVKVGGNVWTWVGQQSGLSAASVGGSVTHLGSGQVGRALLTGLLGGLLAVGLVVSGSLLALTGLCYAALGRRRLGVIADAFTGNAAACFLVGLGTCFGLFAVGVALAALLPVSIPVAAGVSLLSAVGYSGLSFGIGRNVLPGWRRVPSTLAAAMLVLCIQAIPVVGWSVLVVLWNVAVGAAVMSGFGASRDWLAQRADGRLPI